jgi:2-polyprenyl-3-methyl-5-hydroxy-6-metoxy-1,4-benzoquinol methylase
VELHCCPNRKSGEEQQSNQLGDLEWRLVSWGPIEHFTDTESVISAHVNLLKPGGILIVSIPNLRGFNRWQVERWAADLLPLHNLSMLLGYPTSGQMTLTTKFDDFIRYWGAFVQGDFRVTPKLTLNYGIHFEYETGVQEENKQAGNGV